MPYKLGIILLILLSVIGTVFVFVSKGLPAENMAQAEEDYIAIMEQAENWPAIKEMYDRHYMWKIHQSPNNSDYRILTVWFINKNNNYTYELFAKAFFNQSEQFLGMSIRFKKSMLKTIGGDWIVGNYIRVSYEWLDSEQALAVRLFDNQDKSNSIAMRVFLLKDLALPKK